MEAMQRLLDFISKLDQRKIYRKLDSVRGEAIMVEVYMPGERWEVEFFADGAVEVEVFKSAGPVLSGRDALEALQRLFREHDQAEEESRRMLGQAK